ncbi:SAM-dependent methyltransferase [Micromonospora sp. PLK6-60]|uniref:SAM-dependent methyltransferase n=1 Tax=Micromonospora sp. PLK6-60 TaxID=2873383 RepID=UPI002102AD26|nr:SAM-dependent methyltransferase [Micromonospora sp. PLK6-60]
MDRALYGPGGFFVAGRGPAAHFRTSVHASPVFVACLLRLVESVDRALGRPARFEVVDVGAGRGELLRALSLAAGQSPAALARRLRLTAVEKAPRPADLPPEIDWRPDIPADITGLLLATEWLDNVPLDLATPTPTGWHYLLVDPTTGNERPGPPLTPQDAHWLHHWWPGAVRRGEIGRARDEAWAGAVGNVARGVAVAVDYGHLRGERPVDGTLTGYRDGRQVPPVPDGSCDVTAHVAMDSVAAAGERVAGCAYTLVSQREALRALGADGGRPPLALASRDPAGYLRALAAASAVAELTDPAGLGGHRWLLQPVGVALPPPMAR